MPGRSVVARPKGPINLRQDGEPVDLVAGGFFERLAGARQITVNSLHGQGINRLASGLAVEATAPDGQIEAGGGCARRASSWAYSGTRNTRLGDDPFSARALRRLRARGRALAARRGG